MADERSRSLLIEWLPLISIVIAVMSLVSSFFQSFNYSRNIDVAQRNVLRAESLRTCKEIIDAYFQFRLAVMEESEAGARDGAATGSDARLKPLVFRLGALGTFLANFREESRERYTAFTRKLTDIAARARATRPADVEALFGKADASFAVMNDDCVRVAKLFGAEGAR